MIDPAGRTGRIGSGRPGRCFERIGGDGDEAVRTRRRRRGARPFVAGELVPSVVEVVALAPTASEFRL